MEYNNRLIRIMIVDDEAIICEGLQMTIDWSKLGAEVIDTAYDGEEALRKIADNPPDILLSDIRMDGMDGLELAERLKAIHPQLHIVMISGYEDFEYARRAMRTGVRDYLLKPVEIEELEKVVGRIAARIREKAASGSREENQEWLLNAIGGNSGVTEACPPVLGNKSGGSFRIIASQLAEFSKHYAGLSADERQTLHERWVLSLHSQLLEEGLETMHAFDHPNALYMLVHTSEDPGESWWESLLNEVSLNWSEGEGMYLAVTGAYSSPDGTASACEKARQLMGYHVLQAGQPLTEQGCRALERDRQLKRFTPAADWAARLCAVLFRQEWADTKAMIQELFAEMRGHRMLLAEMNAMYEEQMALLRQRLRRNGLQLEQIADSQQGIDLLLHNSYGALEKLALEELRTLYEMVGELAVNKSYWIVEKAMKHVAEHYSEDIKASEVAEWLGITPNHFSFIFKQNSGKNFKEYMNDVRIGHAQRLLETTNDKVFEIADQVGYKEYKYFVSVFKSVTGMTPKQYRALKVGL
ncbi:response regulator [Paenibacillus sp. HB172176]|uniref:response regulator n=1 Tax=Paenibacillus sp. HB172176 TaxID=2493690 RepID=UPI001439D114|nr:response regulator [Paenibacillus sp. HB172176]